MEATPHQVLVRLNLEDLSDLRTAPWITTFSFGSFEGIVEAQQRTTVYPVEIYDFRRGTAIAAQRYVDASSQDFDTLRRLLLELEKAVNKPATLILKHNAPNQITVSLHEATGEPDGVLVQRMQRGLEGFNAPKWLHAGTVRDHRYPHAFGKMLVVGHTTREQRLCLTAQPDDFRIRANLQATLMLELGYIETHTASK